MADGSPGLVIFDCDGVFIDGERIAANVAKVDAYVLERLGWPMSEAEVVEQEAGAGSLPARVPEPGLRVPGVRRYRG
jgi:beta-phosphoglucomutase-like phosphatase (HAD superfamily)